MDIAQFILNRLVDKYETSTQFKDELKSHRKIRFYFNTQSFPGYFNDSIIGINTLTNDISKNLETEGLIEIEWVKHEENNIIKAVCLNIEQMNKIYEILGRTPKRNSLNSLMDTLKEYESKTSLTWLKTYFSDLLQEINIKQDIPTGFPKDPETIDLLFSALKGIETNAGEEIAERIFSCRYLKNSKSFMKVRSRIISIAVKYLNLSPELDDESILQELGILKNIEDVSFCGSMIVKFSDFLIDFSPFKYGVAINSKMIEEMEIVSLSVQYIITFENKTNYLNFAQNKVRPFPNALGIFLAGFHSPKKRLFLDKLKEKVLETNQTIQFYHWGDIDLGGMRIFNHLKKSVLPTLKPYQMDIESLMRSLDYAESMEEKYAKELESLLLDSEYFVFHDLINTMLKYNVKLEQETLLI